ncbi:hypothetical protein HO173_010343 [Letharia columbiana]|uniref:F-box domain-containing protein n=1 Tax=Letharia columbiana TaxID=112416 RepID=A0A8H6FMQ6_9LECA|nr:uncharacterized protein HO173_010343 [Letharia columbiana]KAF6231383.1 hypothetical protein HO173_010343 [Letharia columbiana]
MASTIVASTLRALTYSRGDICDRTINTEYLQNDCPLDQTSANAHLACRIQPATASLGRLDILPVETIQIIFSNTDLSTLTLLRSVSRRASCLVDSVPAYKKAVTHSPNALRALISTHTAQYFTANDVFDALLAHECFLCGRFGAFLYLLECRRCCWDCLISVEDLLPICKASAQTLYRFDAQTMDEMPTVLTIPGSYGLRHKQSTHRQPKGEKRVAMVAYGAARKAGLNVQMGKKLTDHYEKAKLETRVALRGPVAQDPMRDMDCMNYDHAGYKAGFGLEPQRFMAAVRFPTLITGTDKIEWGFSCLGCLERAEYGDEERFWNEQYTTEGMVRHLDKCQRAGQSWINDRVTEVHGR